MDDPETFAEPANIKFLRWLVTILTAVMICGLLVIIGLFVTRLGGTAQVAPEKIVLPKGVAARAFTTGPDWYAVVTSADEILIYNRSSGELRQRVKIESE